MFSPGLMTGPGDAFSSHSDLTILIISPSLVSSKIPARFLTSEL